MIHSYSSLSMFEKCPQQYYQVRVLKAYPYQPSAEAQWGDYAHNQLEAAGNALVQGQRPQLTPDLSAYQWIVDKLLPSLPGDRLFEFEFNFNRGWQNVAARDWNNKFWTGKGDVIAITPDRKAGIYIDYKTGRDDYPDVKQLELMSVFMKTSFPTLEHVRAGLLFLQTGKAVTRDYTLHQIPALKTMWEQRAMEVELAKSSNSWPMKKSALCPYCPHKTCPNWTPPKSKK